MIVGALGATGWCIVIKYFEGIQEMESGPFGGFQRSGVLPDYGHGLIMP